MENSSSDDNDLDTSWIREEEKLETIEKNYQREPMENIDIFFLYINADDYIEKIICENHSLSDIVLKKEYILHLIQSKKRTLNSHRYKFMDMLLFNADLDPDHIQTFSQTEINLENARGFLKTYPIVDDVAISPSIFIFHNINSLFFLFKENPNEPMPIKSILKKDGPLRSLHKVTKKVRIIVDKSHSGMTKKNRSEQI
jgi:hypothetical protein